MIKRYWDVPYRNRPRWETDPAKPPFPYLAFGSITNLGNQPVAAPNVTAAWLDQDGKVIWILTTKALELSAGGAVAKELRPGGISDFYLMVDDLTMGPRLLGATSDVAGLMIWAHGG